MTTYKLNITYTFDDDELVSAETFARILLLEQHIHGSCIPEVSLTRQGDRSGANLIAKIGPVHYKHTKIPITEYSGYNEAHADDRTYDEGDIREGEV